MPSSNKTIHMLLRVKSIVCLDRVLFPIQKGGTGRNHAANFSCLTGNCFFLLISPHLFFVASLWNTSSIIFTRQETISFSKDTTSQSQVTEPDRDLNISSHRGALISLKHWDILPAFIFHILYVQVWLRNCFVTEQNKCLSSLMSVNMAR